MIGVFYASALIGFIAALLAITGTNPMRALVNLVVVFLAISSVLWTVGAPFTAALQILIYAGAIAVLFVFAVMMLNLGEETISREREWLHSSVWILPMAIAIVLAIQFVTAFARQGGNPNLIGSKTVGISMFSVYMIAVELASLLLVAGLIAAFHFAEVLRRKETEDD